MFAASTPVQGGKFHNRKEELRVLEQVVTQLINGTPCWVAIMGPRKVGKTSLLLELQRRQSEQCSFAVVDAQETSAGSMEFFRLYALRLLDGLLAPELGFSLEVLQGDPEGYRDALVGLDKVMLLPRALRGQLLRLVEAKADEGLMRLALALPEHLARTWDTHVLVAIDEFQALKEMRSGRRSFDPLPLMRSVWQRHERVTYIVSGSSRRMLTALVSSEKSPFFQHFDLLEIGPFKTADGIQLLRTNLRADTDLSLADARQAVELLDGNPFYIQLLTRSLLDHEPPHDFQTVRQALSELLFSRTGRLSLYFENEYNKRVGRSFYLAAVLGALSAGSQSLSQLAKKIKVSSGEASNYIERLGDLVVKSSADDLYSLIDPVFTLWLKWRQPGGASLPMALLGDAAERTVATYLARLGFELIYQSRASRGAFDILAMRGPHSVGLQIKRSRLPLRVTAAEWQRMENDAERFGWQWLLVSVSPDDESVSFLDPQKASNLSLGTGAVVDNLLAWLNNRPA